MLPLVKLSNLHRTTELLQHFVHALRLSKKLRDLMAIEPDKLDLAKAVQFHSEIISLCDEYDLIGIDVVDEELRWMRETELSDPHRSIASKTAQLSNLHRTTELLQHSVRALCLSKKLRDLMVVEPDKLDLTKAVQFHSEIISLCDEYDLTGIDVVDEELRW
ncbi:hypothetical protein RYX36_006889, partial [Vicia faba]